MAGKPIKLLDGRSMLYPYLQHDLQKKDIWLFQMLVSRLVVSMGVWFCPEAYQVLPIAVPFALRHPLSRGSKRDGIPDQWGSPTEQGYFMDDNSLVKNLVKSLTISSPSQLMDAARIEKGFVASHVWQLNAAGKPSARDPLTYSFLPNVLWLPSDVSKLSDRAGFTQAFLQALATKIYRHVEVPPPVKGPVEAAWKKLPDPDGIPDQGLPDLTALNWFRPPAKWLEARAATVMTVGAALVGVSEGRTPPGKVFSTRFTEGLPTVEKAAARALGDQLLAVGEGAFKALGAYPF